MAVEAEPPTPERASRKQDIYNPFTPVRGEHCELDTAGDDEKEAVHIAALLANDTPLGRGPQVTTPSKETLNLMLQVPQNRHLREEWKAGLFSIVSVHNRIDRSVGPLGL